MSKTWLTAPGMVNSCTKWLQLHEVTCYFGAIRKTLVTLMSKFSCFGVQWFSLRGKESTQTQGTTSPDLTPSVLFWFSAMPWLHGAQMNISLLRNVCMGLGKLFKFIEPIVLSFKKNTECADFETSFGWRTVSSFSKSSCFIQPI